MIEVGTKVYKPTGYSFPGTVVAVFEMLSGQVRYVVESALAPGLLHIFAPNQLRVTPSQSSDPEPEEQD